MAWPLRPPPSLELNSHRNFIKSAKEFLYGPAFYAPPPFNGQAISGNYAVNPVDAIGVLWLAFINISRNIQGISHFTLYILVVYFTLYNNFFSLCIVY